MSETKNTKKYVRSTEAETLAEALLIIQGVNRYGEPYHLITVRQQFGERGFVDAEFAAWAEAQGVERITIRPRPKK